RVLLGLLEELPRQRHVAVIDAVHDREVGHVRRAVLANGADGGRDHAFEAGRDRLERHAQGLALVECSCGHSAIPAFGPGVWSSPRSTVTSTRTVSCVQRLRIISGGSPISDVAVAKASWC